MPLCILSDGPTFVIDQLLGSLELVDQVWWTKYIIYQWQTCCIVNNQKWLFSGSPKLTSLPWNCFYSWSFFRQFRIRTTPGSGSKIASGPGVQPLPGFSISGRQYLWMILRCIVHALQSEQPLVLSISGYFCILLKSEMLTKTLQLIEYGYTEDTWMSSQLRHNFKASHAVHWPDDITTSNF